MIFQRSFVSLFTLVAAALLTCCASELFAAPRSETRSIADHSLQWPTWEQWLRVLLLRDYNTRIVVLGTTLLGCASGMVGSFTLLRKRALMGDALCHATLPGIASAFLIATLLGGEGKSLVVLHLGATISGLLGMATILAIRHLTRLKEDTALGIVLSVFFGGGIALLAITQQTGGNSSGLESFILGKTASMGARDAYLILTAAALSVGVSLLLFKELKLLCFDEEFAGSRGVPVIWLDITLMALVVAVSIVGLQAVGLVLMIALLVIPAAAARFWTEQMWQMATISAVLGALGGMLGAEISALFANLPSGALIVLVCTCFFLFSMVFGSARGLVVRWQRRRRLNRSVDRQHLLRAMYEMLEASQRLETTPVQTVAIPSLLAKRSWNGGRLRRAIRRAVDDQLLVQTGDDVRLTSRGLLEAARLTRQHRLWELYLITYADIAPSRVDRDADAIEHVLEPEVVAELETLLERERIDIPQSPHALAGSPLQGGAT